MQDWFIDDLLADGTDHGGDATGEMAHPGTGRLGSQPDSLTLPISLLTVEWDSLTVLLVGDVQHQVVARSDVR